MNIKPKWRKSFETQISLNTGEDSNQKLFVAGISYYFKDM